MNHIPREARADGLQSALPFIETTEGLVLQNIEQHALAGRTAEEVHEDLTGDGHKVTLNSVRSRITELYNKGRITPAGKRKSERSGINITVWSIPR